MNLFIILITAIDQGVQLKTSRSFKAADPFFTISDQRWGNVAKLLERATKKSQKDLRNRRAGMRFPEGTCSQTSFFSNTQFKEKFVSDI